MSIRDIGKHIFLVDPLYKKKLLQKSVRGSQHLKSCYNKYRTNYGTIPVQLLETYRLWMMWRRRAKHVTIPIAWPETKIQNKLTRKQFT